jgi:hypothetical protein
VDVLAAAGLLDVGDVLDGKLGADDRPLLDQEAAALRGARRVADAQLVVAVVAADERDLTARIVGSRSAIVGELSLVILASADVATLMR